MNKPGRNIAASVQAKLLQLSRNSKLSLQDLLERYCTERLLYRLSRSPHQSRFILKGAMLLIAWGEGSSERVARDADLLGFGDNSPTTAVATFREICGIKVEDDGVEFEIDTIAADEIRAEREYVGVRVTLRARVGNARIPVQADIGFGDAFTMEPEEIEFPSLLEMPRPVLKAYTKETALAEKFEAMVTLGERNSRMKDYFDVWLLSQ
jgi:predicted nucleotidyltransferase component of viral defense system